MTEAMAAVVRQQGGRFGVERISLEEPRDDEVLVRIAGVGVCHTDLIVRDQHFPTPLPAILGHEGSGEVVRVGAAVTKVAPGDKVVLSFASCGACRNCRVGRPGYCSELYQRNFSGARPDGSSPCCDESGGRLNAFFFGQSSFADHAIASERSVVKIPADMPVELMGPLGCGIQTGAGAVMNALQPEAGSAIAIFGAGSVGLAAVLAAKLVGCAPIVAIDPNPARRALAGELGATHVLDPTDGSDVVAAIRELTPDGDGVDYSLECTALPSVARQAVDALRLTGECGIVGAAPLGTEMSLDMNGILFGRTVRGIIEGDSVPDVFIPRLVELWRQGLFPFDRLIEVFPFARIQDAVDASERGTVVKAVLVHA